MEQQGRRPALVVQNDRGNRSSGHTVIVAISSAPLPTRFPFTVLLDPGEASLVGASHVNCAQLRTVDRSRLDGLIGRLDANRMAEVGAALRYELEL